MRKFLLGGFFILIFHSSVFADEVGDLKEQIQFMQDQFNQQFAEMQKQHNEMIQNMQVRVKLLEDQKGNQQVQLKNQKDQWRETNSGLFSKQLGASTVKLMDISFNGLFTAGGSTARENEIDQLQTGAHDPKKRGFTTQNLELSMLGAVDPYLNGEVHIIYQIDKDGESKLEVEEAFLTTQMLPYDLQAKTGTYFTEFGRLNSQHPHSWDFVDQPIVNSRMFGGDGLRGPGARLSWIASLPWYSEIFGGVQNANGETAFSFLNAEGEDFSGYTLIERDVRSTKDLLYSTRWLNSFDINEALTLNLGVSSLWGPNASAMDTQTKIYGTDIYLKWKPVINDKGFPFISWQTELMKRDYEAGEEKNKLEDWGLYTQMLWGFKKNWVAGVRYDLVDGNGESTDYLRDRRDRISPNLTWHLTEFSKVRLQYNYDRAQHINEDRNGDDHSVWLQYEFMLGAHPKHKF